jgi:hypothetical protein
VASSLLGIPRQTIDLDVVIELREEDVEGLIEAAAADFYVSESAVRQAVRYHRGFNLIHPGTAFKLDVYVSGGSEFDEEQFVRSQEVSLPGIALPLRVSSAEDVILRKLEWYRLGGEVSDRQWYDVLGVLKVQRERLDAAYLSRWARRRGLDGLLGRARREAGI